MVRAVSCRGGSSIGRMPMKRNGSSLNLTATPRVLYPACQEPNDISENHLKLLREC